MRLEIGRSWKRGDYGWSQSYQDVLDLRMKYEALLKEAERPRAETPRALAVGDRIRHKKSGQTGTVAGLPKKVWVSVDGLPGPAHEWLAENLEVVPTGSANHG